LPFLQGQALAQVPRNPQGQQGEFLKHNVFCCSSSEFFDLNSFAPETSTRLFPDTLTFGHLFVSALDDIFTS
jgi:hypothetical protein